MAADEQMNDQEYKDLITYAGMADLAGVKLRTVYQWRKRGLLPDVSPASRNRRPVWSKTDVEKWLYATGRHPAQAV